MDIFDDEGPVYDPGAGVDSQPVAELPSAVSTKFFIYVDKILAVYGRCSVGDCEICNSPRLKQYEVYFASGDEYYMIAVFDYFYRNTKVALEKAIACAEENSCL